MEEKDNISYEELLELHKKLRVKYEAISDECIKNKEPWEVFKNKSRDIAIEMFNLDKDIRLKQEPAMTFGREATGKKMTLDDFVSKCTSGVYSDTDGEGYYATDNGVSDINIFPSDITSSKYRNDFTHVVWYEN